MEESSSDQFASNRPSNSMENLAALASRKPLLAILYVLFVFGIYACLFYFTGSLIASLFHFPKWHCIGLVALLRMCFT